MKRTRIAMGALALVAALAASERADAAGQVPPSCQGGIAERSYEMGLRLGGMLVSSAWARVSDCDQLEYFLDIVADNVGRLTLQPGASAAMACRYAGTVDGVYDALDDLYGTCSDQCFLEGSFAGEISAQVYCELSIALGGLGLADDFMRGPVQTCGLNFEVGCDATFIGVSLSYVNALGSCAPYTQGEYFPVWDQARHNQCIYEPEPDDSGAIVLGFDPEANKED
jgi:hypothetical protein